MDTRDRTRRVEAEAPQAILRMKDADGLREWRARKWTAFRELPEIVDVTVSARDLFALLEPLWPGRRVRRSTPPLDLLRQVHRRHGLRLVDGEPLGLRLAPVDQPQQPADLAVIRDSVGVFLLDSTPGCGSSDRVELPWLIPAGVPVEANVRVHVQSRRGCDQGSEAGKPSRAFPCGDSRCEWMRTFTPERRARSKPAGGLCGWSLNAAGVGDGVLFIPDCAPGWAP